MDSIGTGRTFLSEKLKSTHLTEQAQHKIIIGIDYGTTFTGVSYVTTQSSSIDDIDVISTWPGTSQTSWRIPTRIAYKKENPNIRRNKWGFEVDPELISYSWTKLFLDKNTNVGPFDDPAVSEIITHRRKLLLDKSAVISPSDDSTLSNNLGQGTMQLPHFRDAEEVCEDFLHEVYLYVTGRLREQMTDFTCEHTPMECWITLPAIWSEEAKASTLKAARKSGFGSRLDDSVFTIAEPEAAAIATLKQYSELNAFNSIKPNDNILICNCGGGAVDITTYTITQIQPFLEFDELCIGVGGKCGSTYIDRNLHKLLSDRFGIAFDHLEVAQKSPGSRLMDCFEMLKRDFGLDNDTKERELGPIRLDIADSKYYDEYKSMIKLSHEDMQSLFDPVITKITTMLSQQVTEAKMKRDAMIDRIVLVGGFGESTYLYNALTAWCLQNGNITLMRPRHPQSAVVLGAALRGSEGTRLRLKQARRHYGIGVSQVFREGKDRESNANYGEVAGVKFCNNRIAWYISKGEEIFEGTSREIRCRYIRTPGDPVCWESILYSSTSDVPPDYSDDPTVQDVGKIVPLFAKDFDFGTAAYSYINTMTSQFLERVDFTLQIRFGDKGDNLTFKTLVNDVITSSAAIEFSINPDSFVTV